MKTVALALVVLLSACPGAAAARGSGKGHHHDRRWRQPPPPGLSADGLPAAAPSPAAAGLAVDGEAIEGASAVADVEMSFDIANYDYGDLEKQADHGEIVDRGEAALLQTGRMLGEVITCTIGEVYEEIIKEGLENASQAESVVGASMPEVEVSMPEPGSSMPQDWAAGLRGAAKGGAVEPSAKQVDVFVTFQPGPELSRHHDEEDEEEDGEGDGKSFLQRRGATARKEKMATAIHVVITDKPGTGVNLLPEVGSILEQSQESGLLKRRVKTALFQATGISPRIKGIADPPPVMGQLKQWGEGSCENHVERMVGMMEVAYTRRMVPLALFNECTNFIPSLTFSHDPVGTHLDKQKCREAAVRFTKRWDYGRANWEHGSEEGLAPMNLTAFCHDVCETRFGEGAPQCSVVEKVKQGA